MRLELMSYELLRRCILAIVSLSLLFVSAHATCDNLAGRRVANVCSALSVGYGIPVQVIFLACWVRATLFSAL